VGKQAEEKGSQRENQKQAGGTQTELYYACSGLAAGMVSRRREHRDSWSLVARRGSYN
jgi:hypothetical protein